MEQSARTSGRFEEVPPVIFFTLIGCRERYNDDTSGTQGTKIITQVDPNTIFQALESPYFAVAADYPDLTIIAQNDAHAKVSLKKPSDVIGKKLLDAYPDTSEEYVTTGVSPLVESINKVIRTGKPDTMPDIQYDLKDKTGKWVERFWTVTHYPIFENDKVVAVYQATKDITEEKVMEQTLDKTKTQLEQILASSMVGTWNWDFTEQKVTADRNLATMFGISIDAATAGLPLQRFIDSIHPDDRERVQVQIEVAVASGKPYEAEYRTYAKKKNVRWVLARGNVNYTADAKPRSFSGTIIDITDRKIAEQALIESEHNLRFMADVMPQLVWIARSDGSREYYNRQWYDYTGATPGTIGDAEWIGLYHPDDFPRTSKAWRHCLKTGQPFEAEFRLYHAPSKAFRWVIGRALPLTDADGNVLKWYGTCTDIDEQKRTADQQTFLGNVSKELSATLEIPTLLTKITRLSVPIISDWCTVDLYSEEKGFEQVSVTHADPKKLHQAKEYRRHNPLNIDDDTAIPRMLKTGQPEFYPVITDHMLEATIEDEATLRFMKSLHLCSIMIVPLKQGDKTVGGISFISSDSGRYFSDGDFQMAIELANRVSLSMTNAQLYDDSMKEIKRRRDLERQLRVEKQTLERRVKERTQQLQLTNQGLRDEILRRQVAEQDLNEYSDELMRSNKELEDFAYVASHDLQEPLRKIQAFGNLLLTEYGDSLGLEGADYLQRMHAAAGRMSSLIEDLLTFSRVTRKVAAPRPIDLNDTLGDVLSDLETRITNTGAKVIIGKMPTVSADPTHMRQLFQNLIGNAVKFHKTDVAPVVKVASRSTKGGYEITVTDNGIGFDEKYTDRIFAVFQRLNERSSYEGTGIGLAVCRKIVERYGGTITAASSKGEGATFTVWLPKVKGSRK